MAAVIGKNIMLYKKESNAYFYMNGSIPVTTISGVTYNQLGSTNNLAAGVNFSRVADGIVAAFITDVATTTIPAGVWSFSGFASITGDLVTNPRIVLKTYVYNGTTKTLINAADAMFFTQLEVKQYSVNFGIPALTLAANERIIIEVWASEIYERTMTFYTQGVYVASVKTTIPLNIPFACSTNATFSVEVDQKEVTSQSSAWYREFKNDVATWSLTCEGLITLAGYGYNQMLQVQQSRTPISVDFVVDNGVSGLTVISGSVNLTSLQVNAPYKDVATYSVSLQGSGAYSVTGTTAASGGVVIKGGSVSTKGYTAAGGETSLTYTDLIGKTALYVSRGGIDVQDIISSGTPIDEQVKWVESTGVLTFSRALESGEYVRFLAQ